MKCQHEIGSNSLRSLIADSNNEHKILWHKDRLWPIF